jgi:hypothetical protein
MLIWIGDVRYESEELMAILKDDVGQVSRMIRCLEIEREVKLRAIRMVWLLVE